MKHNPPAFFGPNSSRNTQRIRSLHSKPSAIRSKLGFIFLCSVYFGSAAGLRRLTTRLRNCSYIPGLLRIYDILCHSAGSSVPLQNKATFYKNNSWFLFEYMIS